MDRSTRPETHYAAPSALVQGKFVDDVIIAVDERGDIVSVGQGRQSGAIPLKGIVLPGMPDVHSHAFQRAMAGLAERASPVGDNFWSWREAMYRFAEHVGPEDIEAIAAQLYVELLRHGFTTVAEFHYMHNAPDGSAYADPAELSKRIAVAARTSGIGLTLLPVLYQTSGFGGRPPTEGQRRFIRTSSNFIKLVEALQSNFEGDPQVVVGIAPHSLRAITPQSLEEAVEAITRLNKDAPIHIHAAEQDREVDDCLAWSGERPIDWLLNHAPVDRRWCLIHCTQATDSEIARLAASGAVAGLCPSTEANLGDGVFPLPSYLRQGGMFGIGTDSNVGVSPADELRWLEYVQRLVNKQRNLSESESGAHTGAGLFCRALAGGAQACGRKIGEIAPGYRADLVVLDSDHPALIGHRGETAIDAWVFSGNDTPVRDVMVGGRFVVENGRHRAQDDIFARYRRCITGLIG